MFCVSMEAGHLDQNSDKLIYAHLIWKQKEDNRVFMALLQNTFSPSSVVTTQTQLLQ